MSANKFENSYEKQSPLQIGCKGDCFILSFLIDNHAKVNVRNIF